jgi:anti-sigma factor RsiW
MTDHLTPDLLNALADGELSADQLTSAQSHLADCPSCTSQALTQSLLKSAVARTGRRYAPPAHLHERLAHLAQQQIAPPAPSPSSASLRPVAASAFYGWTAACALLLISVSIFLYQRQAHRAALASAESSALVSEVCDQHIATLAANTPPQVLSSDRHTVKPWFQGKLPFSFNLPENLPADTRLEGANLTYLHNQPAALLLYSIGKHRVSVFVQQKSRATGSSSPSTNHAGFHIAAFATSDLDFVAVSDVDPARLSGLAALIQNAQDKADQPAN